MPTLTDANPELVRLVIDDQWDRGNDMFGKGQVRDPLDGKTVGDHDAARRRAVRGMLAKGEIKTASDYYFSALIFQHSSDSRGFILAHVLSMTAAAKGNEAARYMAAATMDRYLHSINQPQIFGTQFFHGADNSWTMDPYDRNAISDSERAIWCVALYHSRMSFWLSTTLADLRGPSYRAASKQGPSGYYRLFLSEAK